jgi:2-keto-4-pentenoate hydratase/2-oxohepta-3-ene-1,7-dioic acid hydratase in catechol pathway
MRLARVIDKTGRTTWAAQGRDGALCRCEQVALQDLSRTTVTAERIEVARFLPPVDPRALICVAASYRKHIEESRLTEQPDPVLFMKNPAAATGHREPIRIPAVCADEVDYEGELAVVLGRDCRDATGAEAARAIAGYTVANDVSARIWQLERGGGQWVRGKSFDTFAPLGPFLVTPDEVGDPGTLTLRTLLDGETVQETSTALMIRGVAELLCFLSQGTTLLAGSVILTGTPEGVGWFRQPRKLLRPGSVVSVEIENVGTLVNPVVGQAQASPSR